ncbi:esterase/lipase family protein [Vampirovibrio chlorellavorus]|uniref:esterase/lipase family protein n=1 Tax=Vampirovibrio chlorellavorus TaxID=758823 RepID=UPI0026EC863D|nr:hypothetical protein [Vampirovibrio chlorellavorus]
MNLKNSLLKALLVNFLLLTQLGAAVLTAGATNVHNQAPHRGALSQAAGWEDDFSKGFLLPRQRSYKSLNQIYQFERSPLGNRIPVLLVPGRAEEFQHNSWWRAIRQVARKDLAFNRYFKLYVFLYNSKEELDVQAEGLVKQLKTRFGDLPPSQPFMLVTYSLGGVIAREVAKDPALLSKIDTIIAIAVPFHGSPMFDPDWFSEYLNPPTRSPLRRFWDRTLYRGYMFSKSNLTRGLNWDNFDSSRPQFDAEESHTLAGDQVTVRTKTYEEYPNADLIRKKTIVYASYLQNAYTDPDLINPKSALKKSLTLPRTAVDAVLPFYGFTVHGVLTYMGLQLANVPAYTPEDPQGKNTLLYRYNDGAIPVSSMLFLKPSPKPYNEDIWGLINMATVRNVRIFPGLDHLHIGEYSIEKKRLITADLVHPEEGKRSPHHWILYDLFRRMRELKLQE